MGTTTYHCEPAQLTSRKKPRILFTDPSLLRSPVPSPSFVGSFPSAPLGRVVRGTRKGISPLAGGHAKIQQHQTCAPSNGRRKAVQSRITPGSLRASHPPNPGASPLMVPLVSRLDKDAPHQESTRNSGAAPAGMSLATEQGYGTNRRAERVDKCFASA
ncbi:hypothetical protein CKAH01_14441 [Colletotrichum kahawae]|uniref:Uncharacterized protein n=1 Tax=Colletotrichum kahawae TaxID=34407 RepID=A0AAD9YKD2_COLKA|nr:hypothetical protein CKAH01_14441 [Colletotrichum kahawae]